MSDPEILIEQANNRGTFYAAVEQDERAAYFYLYPNEVLSSKYSPRPCWLRNLQPAPETRDVAAMKEGMAPMLEVQFCNHPQGKEPLQRERLSIVWLPEGDSAAVLYDGEVLGAIPSWELYTGEKAGSYAADCIDASEHSMTFPLGTPETNQLYGRVKAAMAFWEDWSDDTSQAWGVLQEQFITAYEAQWGKVVKYFAIDGDQWPPMGLGWFEQNDVVYLATMGVSIRPMPMVELIYMEEAPGFRRMELAMALSRKDFSDAEIMELAAIISGLADKPWKQLTWLGEGHTVAAAELPAPFESVVLSTALYNGAALQLPLAYSDKVNLFWLSPITQLEREFAHHKPNGGYDLLEKMIDGQINHVVTKRNALTFE
ncbi:suppressor of fused domain protein [Chitinophaga nivalis]|uniref:Suppressor of fused domain protein n=1 Tax=Chitinophaga nivalis TaxID=2991709 RepID=A0ABT3IEP2_9BACT|nr:suppressor of fused domain protein [Chitinophaga nivalis]MCW3467883.1 suppressor of fused domain protein [Chitinophaga nivalis]MCW3482426.1 suppressor of fused domain protein [Chitinophaga nivalis]